MEDTHGEDIGGWAMAALSGLNPYCNGRYSWSNMKATEYAALQIVLILIVMEDTHGEERVIANGGNQLES